VIGDKAIADASIRSLLQCGANEARLFVLKVVNVVACNNKIKENE
jgi:hypothetical protein